MKIQKLRLPECHTAEGLVVVIDVIRAFTTAAFAFAAGADKIVAVGTISEAFDAQKKYQDSLIMGEENGLLVPGFHYGNSPVEIAQQNLQGKTLIQRTSSGTQGIVRSKKAEQMLVSSFVIAEATLKRIQNIAPRQVGFIVTGTTRGGEEDLALAEYLEEKLIHGKADSNLYLERVVQSPTGLAFASGKYPHSPKHDLDSACEIDRFPFAIEVTKEDGYDVLRPIDASGKRPISLKRLLGN